MKNIKKYVYNSVVLLLIVIGASIVIVNFGHFGHVEFTDNARVRQHVTPQNTRVQGFVKEERFEEFQHVKKGDTLPALKAAYVEETVYVGADQLDALAAIKSKNELIADVVALLQSPAKNVVSALQSGATKLHGILETLSKKED